MSIDKRKRMISSRNIDRSNKAAGDVMVKAICGLEARHYEAFDPQKKSRTRFSPGDESGEAGR
jgi:hypothetical protein